MKIYLNDNGKVQAEAESIQDIKTLLKLSTRTEVPKKVIQHKKHQFKKKCELCGKIFKGLKGLGRHMATHKRHFPLPNDFKTIESGAISIKP